MIRALLTAAVLVAVVPLAAQAADPARDAIIAGYAAEAAKTTPAFGGFSAARGETLFRTSWGGGDARTPACTACHTSSPTQAGRNAKTGRSIDPVAVSVNPKRFTDLEKVEKQFFRDCKSVLGRDCTVVEKGDYLTFMMGQ
jgi:hypothetical protein